MAKRKPQTVLDLPLVEIIWHDASLELDGAGSLADAAGPVAFGGTVECRDVGYLIAENVKDENGRRVTKLAVSISESDNSYRHSNSIPQGWIKRKVILARPAQTEA